MAQSQDNSPTFQSPTPENRLVADYDIASYVRPDLQRRTLSIVPDFSFRNFFGRGTNIDNFSVSMGTSPRLFHTKFINTSEQQTSVTNIVDFSASFRKQTGSIESQTYFSPSMQRYYSRRKFKEEQKFWQLDYNFIGDYGVQNEKEMTRPTATKKYRFNTELGVAMYKGKGRIELVTDAWHAATMFEIFENYGLLKATVSAAQIEDFAEVISTIKNTRMTDSRLESISEFKQLSTYLINSNLVNDEDYAFFAVLRDAWGFEAFVNRRSGSEFKIGLRPNISFRTEDNLNLLETPDYYLSPSLMMIAAYNAYEPLSLDWQFDQTYNLETGLTFFENLTGSSFTFIPTVEWTSRLNMDWDWTFLPNRRTNYSLGVSFISALYRPLSDDVSYDFRYFFSLALTGHYEYYVSPRLSWIINGSVNIQTFSSEFATPERFSNNNRLTIQANYRFY